METIVFTNGCFDIIHPGHVDLLKQARSLGTRLIVGINSDRSVREIKGSTRPLLDQDSRAAVLRELRSVDEVRIFDENTPERIIKEINPHVLVKGGDWKTDQIIGADFVLENGGRVFSIPFKQNISTTQIIEKIEADGNTTTARKVSAETEEIFQLPAAVADIKRGAELIADVLSKEGKIHIVNFSEQSIETERLAEDYKRYFGDERVSLLKMAETLEISGDFPDAGDLLIGVVGKEIEESFARIMMKARQKDCRTLLITAQNGRKLAALSDVCIMFQAESAEERLWKLETIGYFLLGAVNPQNNIF